MKRLLQRSAEARRLLQRLQSDSRDLIQLPLPRLDRDLAPAILQKIAAQRLAPVRRARKFASAHGYPVWVGFAAAAAVLFMVGAASYCTFAVFLGRPAAPVALVQNQKNQRPIVRDPKAPDEDRKDMAKGPQHEPVDKHQGRAAAPAASERIGAGSSQSIRSRWGSWTRTNRYSHREGMEMFVELKSVTPTLDLPATFKLRDLSQDAAHKKLVAELQNDAAVRLELPCPGRQPRFRAAAGHS